MCNTGFVISAREPWLRPSPRTRAAVNFERVGDRGIHGTGRANLAALVMWLRLVLIVPSIGDIRILTVMPHQACAGHPQMIELGFSQISDIQSQALRPCSITNCSRMKPSP